MACLVTEASVWTTWPKSWHDSRTAVIPTSCQLVWRVV